MTTMMKAAFFTRGFATVLKRGSAFLVGTPTIQVLFFSALGGADLEAGTIRNSGSENEFNAGPK